MPTITKRRRSRATPGKPQHVRSLKIRKKRNIHTDQSLDVKALDNVVQKAIEPLQDQIKILQSNAITTMVIMDDIRNSVILSECSTESTKKTLADLLYNLNLALSNVDEYIGRPKESVVDRVGQPRSAIYGINLATEMESDTGNLGGFAGTEEGDDIIENVSEEFDEADLYQDDMDARRRRR